jgi:hypothetical protein
MLVWGDAKKYFVDPSFKERKDSMIIGERIINLKRPFYRAILQNFKPKDSIVVGDNFSMDLALPLSLGFGVILVKNEFNSWAQEYMESIGKKVIGNLCELV